jgi:hypothetical protein
MVHFINMSNQAHENAEVALVLGGGHDVVGDQYYASEVTANRARAAAQYHEEFPRPEMKYVFTGYFGEVATRGQLQAPPSDRAEAVLAEGIFQDTLTDAALMDRAFDDHWRPSHAPTPQTAIEPESVDTFGNFIKSIEAGYLEIGQFSPDKPMLLGTEEPHAWRSSVIAAQALAMPEGSLFRLPVVNARKEFMVGPRERLLLAVTRLAIANVGETSGAEPGNMTHTREAQKAFIDYSRQPAKAVAAALKHPSLWKAPTIPTVTYPVR